MSSYFHLLFSDTIDNFMRISLRKSILFLIFSVSFYEFSFAQLCPLPPEDAFKYFESLVSSSEDSLYNVEFNQFSIYSADAKTPMMFPSDKKDKRLNFYRTFFLKDFDIELEDGQYYLLCEYEVLLIRDFSKETDRVAKQLVLKRAVRNEEFYSLYFSKQMKVIGRHWREFFPYALGGLAFVGLVMRLYQ